MEGNKKKKAEIEVECFDSKFRILSTVFCSCCGGCREIGNLEQGWEECEMVQLLCKSVWQSLRSHT
jgi:hypothetical protein